MIGIIRLILRLPACLLLGIFGLAMVLILAPVRLLSTRAHLAALAPCQHLLMRLVCLLLGIRVEKHGRPAAARGALLVVSNHLGYLDIPILGSMITGHFVSKAEVQRWPLVGLLASLAGTLYVDRKLPKKSRRQLGQISSNLHRGTKVIGFPEGTTSAGDGILPLRTGLFQAAIETATPVQPVAIEYRRSDGAALQPRERLRKAWVGDDPIGPHIIGVLRSRGMRAIIRFAPLLEPPHPDRRTFARRMRALFQRLLSQPDAAARAPTIPAAPEKPPC